MIARELAAELAMLDPDQPVPATHILGWLDVDLSYVEDALSSWLAIAEMFGRTVNPEVKRFCSHLYRTLTGQ